MATIQGYTKAGVDRKLASRSNVTLSYSGTGTPELSSFPDAKSGDIIERVGDRAQWRVLGNTLVPQSFTVTSVNGKTGDVIVEAQDLEVAPLHHTHTIAQITDLTVSTSTTADHVVKRITGGNITVPTTPNANTSAASKSYVDTETAKKANTSHTHTIAQITDLTVSTAATVNHVVKRTTSGNITVPTTPNANSSAASKSYVDTETAKKADSTHAHTIDQVTGLRDALNSSGSSVHTHVSSDITDSVYGDLTSHPNRVVTTDNNGVLRASSSPEYSSQAVSKAYVDTETGKKADSTHTHTISQISDLTVSTAATANHVVKRISSGNITVPTTPNANTSAASKSYVDTEVGKKANTSHTHTKSNISDLETISTGATGHNIPKRLSTGDITVPTAPSANSSAASKSYVDTETGKKANTSHNHTIDHVTGLRDALNSAGSSVHTHVSSDITDSVQGDSTSSPNRVVTTDINGVLRASSLPEYSSQAVSKFYVDTETGKKADSTHTHTISQISDLTVSTSATSGHVPKRITGGNITVPSSPNASTSAASKSYVDNEVGKKANTYHTHTKSNISDLETISTGATGHNIPKRLNTGDITVPTTPSANSSAASKSYVDTETGKKANTSHTHTISQITDLTVSTAATVNHVVKRTTSGNITVPTTPNVNSSATSKSYVDTEVGKKANTSHTHTIADIIDLTISTTAYANHVVRRSTGGNITVPTTPNADTAATSKSYVDTKTNEAKVWVGNYSEYEALPSSDKINRVCIILNS